MMTADQIIDILGLIPHPEGGHYAETFRDPEPERARAHSTAIYYLLRAGERSHWHRVDATEIWHYHAGASLELSLARDREGIRTVILGPDIVAGERPQGIVPKRHWQAARPLGDWTLVGCTVAPGFTFSDFELAAPCWAP